MNQKSVRIGQMFYFVFLHILCVNLTTCRSDHPIEAVREATGELQTQAPQIYLNFERELEPLERVADRPIDVNDHGNGCLDGVLWNEYYHHNICISPSAPMDVFAIERTSKQSRDGAHSLRFYLEPSPLDEWPVGEPTHRAELGPGGPSLRNPFPTEEEEVWYGISVLFDSNFVFAPESLANELRFSFVQWQHGTAGSPAVALEVYGDQIALARSTGISTESKWIKPYYLTRINKGQWMDLVIQIVWSKDDGQVRIWANGDKVCDKEKIQTVYDDLNRGGGYKFGIYYWRWKDKHSVEHSMDSGIYSRELFVDEIRQFRGPEGFIAVSPGNKF